MTENFADPAATAIPARDPAFMVTPAKCPRGDIGCRRRRGEAIED
jgi:hypothetical protein